MTCSSTSIFVRVSENSIMDHQWRPMPPPPLQGNICPVCSVSHFPFCPPHSHPSYTTHPPPPPPLPFPPYNQYPRLPPYPDYLRSDPYRPGMPGPYTVNANEAWHRNHSFDYREGFVQAEYDYNNTNSNGFVGEADRRYKRPRVDEVGYAVFGHENNQNPAEDERRLKLIRDHGGGASFGRTPDMSFGEGGRFQSDGSSLYSPFQPNQQACEPYGDINLSQNQLKGPESANRSQYSHIQPPVPLPFGMPKYMRNDYQPAPGQEPVGYSSYTDNRGFSAQPPPPPPPPLPASPPPPLPPLHPSSEFKAYPSPPKTSLFPVPIITSATNPYLQNKPLSHTTNSFSSEEWQTSSLLKQSFSDKPTIIDASQLFKQPHRASRPVHIVIILRGLPGSGKSYLAKMMRDVEVESGGSAPRIHSMDDYFMTEVEKVEEIDASKTSSLGRGKKPAVKKVMEYCYEPEMEEAYRDSMLKAFRKTLEEGIFKLVIVDDRNLRVADFAQFWAIAKRSGYEVYISEATYKDPVGCAARNVHGFSLDEIKKMAGQWEEAPASYFQLDIKSLFHGDDLKESGILEVDMDTEDGTGEDNPPGMQERKAVKITPPSENDVPQVPSKDGKRWGVEEDHPTEGVKELGKSKWSNDLDEDDIDISKGTKGNVNALSGLIQAYGRQAKSVRWSDQVGNTGFSIGAAKKANSKSLVIGPGAGYNWKSNPTPKEESITATKSISESKRQSVFQERLRAERESFKAVFEKRKRRIGGLHLEEE